MAFNQYPYQPNYFGAPYQQPIPQQFQQQSVPTPAVQPMQQSVPYASNFGAQQTSLIWVRNRAEVDAYYVAPNGAVALWDEMQPCVYLKKADASGKPTVITYDLVERTDKPVEKNVSFASKDDVMAAITAVEAFRSDIDSVKADIKKMQTDLYGIAGKRKTTAKEATDE